MRDGLRVAAMTWPLCMAGVAAAVLGLDANGAAAKEKNTAPPPSIWQQETLTGDWGGARTALKDKGLEITLNYIGETFGVLSGGIDRRASYEGQLEFSVDSDLDKLIGWTGATTRVTVFQIHNGGYTVAENAGSLSDPSNIDALPATRLYSAWFEQSFGGVASLRVGQLAADGHFMVSDTAGGLLNGTFGWANLAAAAITNGGPSYPLATPGVRLKLKPSDDLTLLAAVFTGDPAGRDCDDDAQKCNRHGTTFSLAGGVLWMGEAQYAVNQGKQAIGLPGIYKLGGWYATADYPDQHYGLDAGGAVVSLADPAVVDPLYRHADWGLYGVADQMVWRQGGRHLNLFLRGGFAPSDRNLVSWYMDGGAGFTGPLPGRPDDVLIFGVSYSKISSAAAALDRDALALSGAPYAIRDDETVFELSYAAQIAPWWTVQPDLQYIVHPNGGRDPNDPTLALDHAFIAGIRSVIKF